MPSRPANASILRRSSNILHRVYIESSAPGEQVASIRLWLHRWSFETIKTLFGNSVCLGALRSPRVISIIAVIRGVKNNLLCQRRFLSTVYYHIKWLERFPLESGLVIFWVHLESVPARAYLFTLEPLQTICSVVRFQVTIFLRDAKLYSRISNFNYLLFEINI